MEPVFASLEKLWRQAAEIAGGGPEAGILTGAALLTGLLAGKLAARYVLGSGRGALAVVLGILLPAVFGILGWAAVDAMLARDLFVAGDRTVTAAQAAGVALFLAGLLICTRPLVSVGMAKSFLLLGIALAAAAGGMLVAQASIAVFHSGEAPIQVRQNQLPPTG